LNFVAMPLLGAYVVEPTLIEDERGFFARSFCRDEFQTLGLNPLIEQCNISSNRRRGTLRGLHFQAKPCQEAKLVRCTRGSVWDVIVDLREDSPTRLQWHAVNLTADNRIGIYIPEGFAHGFQTLMDDTELHYQISATYRPELARGVRYDDPRLAIPWPLENPIVSVRDLGFPSLL